MLNQPQPRQINPDNLGSADFRQNYGLKYAYVAGAMYKGIASTALVIAMGKAGMIGYLGTGGLSLAVVEQAILDIQAALIHDQPYGMNLLADLENAAHEQHTVELFLKHRVQFIEAAAYMQITPSLVFYRLKGISQRPDGSIDIPNRVLGKISRPEVAEVFMRPAPMKIVDKLLAQGLITATEAQLSQSIPMAHEICVESDSGGHTDQGVAYALMPAITTQRDTIMAEQGYDSPIHVGAAGGIGTPQAAGAAFILGADFVLTGSINQCTVEAGTSDRAKDKLQDINVQDTTYSPAGDMFEIGAKVQVMKKGLLFPARANKLYDLYVRHNSLDEIDEKTQKQIQEKFFRRSFAQVWAETAVYLDRQHPGQREIIENSPKRKMAMIFRWYFIHSTRLAMKGSDVQTADYQIHCGPALGAFNQWVKGSDIEPWRQRYVADIAERMMLGTAQLLNQRYTAIMATLA